jgi:hypothetical protein
MVWRAAFERPLRKQKGSATAQSRRGQGIEVGLAEGGG